MAAPPRRRFLPLLLLLSLCLFLLFSAFPTNLTRTRTGPFLTRGSSLRPLPASNFTLTVKVLAYDRPASLARCLRSLAAAYYRSLDHPLNLDIFIDHFPLSSDDAALERRLKDARAILDLVDGFEWRLGEKVVHYRTANAGLQAQWLEAWWPRDENDFAFVVEDDLELSPLYYEFLRGIILNYYYNKSNFSPFIYGATLQRPRFVPGKHGNKLKLDGMRLFLYQLVGTWGQLLFPKPWKEFRLWYDMHKAKGTKPILDGMVTTGWYKRMGERIWTPWFIKFIHSRGYFNLHTNFLHGRALSVSHRDAGVNYAKTAGPDSELLDESSHDLSFVEMPPLSILKWYDFCFREVLPNNFVRSIGELGPVLRTVQKQETIVLVSIFGISETLTRNLVCHFERLKIWNYILVGPSSEFLYDLSRRGHPVVDADHFFDSVRTSESMKVTDSNAEVIRENIVKAFIVKKCLEFRFNSWVMGGDLILVNSNLFLEVTDPSFDVLAGKDARLLFIRSSPSVQKAWGEDVIPDVTARGDSLLSKYSRNFAYSVSELLKQRSVKIKNLDESSLSLKMSSGAVNGSSLPDGTKIIYWSAGRDFNLIQKRLEELGMWSIDGESSCLAVVCNGR